MKSNLESIVKRNAEGDIIELQCQRSKVWLPANTDYFPIDNRSTVVLKTGERLNRWSKQATKITNLHKKYYNEQVKNIENLVEEGRITLKEGLELKSKLDKEPDFYGVGEYDYLV